MKHTNIILYTPGAYGHFINWCCEYFSGALDSDVIPLNDLGNCHAFKKAKLLTIHPQFKNYTESAEEVRFVQIHENSFSHNSCNFAKSEEFLKDFSNNLNYAITNYPKLIYLFTTESSKFWIANNQIFKIRIEDWVGLNTNAAIDFLRSCNVPEEQITNCTLYGIDRIKYQINTEPGMINNFLQWDHSSICEFELWELRELASKYYYDTIKSLILTKDDIAILKNKFPSIYFVEVDNLRENFIDTIKSILKYFDISISNWGNIQNIYNIWLSKQIHINKDKQIDLIIDAITNSHYLNWQEYKLTFLDEMCIQRRLSDNNIEIKCWNLNELPTNTNDLEQYLIRK
jgi:hypothetical protein